MILTSSKITQLFVKASSAEGKTSEANASLPAMKAQLKAWVQSGAALDEELERWSRELPEHWLPLFVSSRDGESLITYQRVSFVVIWNYYRATRIVMRRLLAQLQQAFTSLVVDGAHGADSKLQNDVEACDEIVQDMISGLCRSLPFALGDIDTLGRRASSSLTSLKQEKPRVRAIQGYSLIWPLWYVLSCGLATPSQMDQIKCALDRLGQALGIRLALALSMSKATPATTTRRPLAT